MRYRAIPEDVGRLLMLKCCRRYLAFFLEPLTQHYKGQEENYTFMYNLVESIKQTEDVVTPDNSRVCCVLVAQQCDG